MRIGKKHLTFACLVNAMIETFAKIPDHRTGTSTYSVSETAMCGFAPMYFRDSSLLFFQRQFERSPHRRSNLATMFGVKRIPSDTQIREILDEVPPEAIAPLFGGFFDRLQRGKHLVPFVFYNGAYLANIDATEYFRSEKIECPGCLEFEQKDGTVQYAHQILQVAITHPEQKQIIPLAPEHIRRTDGSEKQDCETNAGKRAVSRIRQEHPKLKLIYNGDDLYSRQPFILDVKAAGASYIFVAKPSSHVSLFENIAGLRRGGCLETLEVRDGKGRQHRYEWMNGVPLNGDKNSVVVNYFEYTLVNEKGKEGYHNSWVTDLPVTGKNVALFSEGGRGRWKIENEGFNTLKTGGYHLEHNFGHGAKHLSFIFFLLNLLAFFIHQIQALCDFAYRRTRAMFDFNIDFWESFRALFRVLEFARMDDLLDEMRKREVPKGG